MGRKLATSRLQQSLPKRVALPVLASDSLSSVAYATQEILVILTLGGLTYLYLTPWVATAVVVAMIIIIAAYRQLARQGVFVEMASAASVAGLLQLHAAGELEAGGTVVCVLTGHGLKDPEWAISGAMTPNTIPPDAASAARELGLT
jgi:threonine synthase